VLTLCLQPLGSKNLSNNNITHYYLQGKDNIPEVALRWSRGRQATTWKRGVTAHLKELGLVRAKAEMITRVRDHKKRRSNVVISFCPGGWEWGSE